MFGISIFLLIFVCNTISITDNDPLLYPTLRNYHRNAQNISSFEWLVKVIISKDGVENHICSAICHKHRLFLTTARCIKGMSPDYMIVRRGAQSSKVIVYILPANFTKQSYNDLAIILTENTTDKWSTVKLYNHSKIDWRKDANFANDKMYTAVGYALSEEDFWLQKEINYDLKQLPVRVGDVCKKLYHKFQSIPYERPCYHSCNSQESSKNDPKCHSYLGVEGAALYDPKSSLVMGIASWGLPVKNGSLPVGIALFDNQMFWHNMLVCANHLLAQRIGRINQWVMHPDLCLDGCEYKYLQWLPRKINY